MAISEVSICNLALGDLGGNLITSLDDESNEAKLCKANFDVCRDAVLEDRDWTFALKRAILSPSASAPIFGDSVYFPLPSDFIRVVRVGTDPAFRTKIDWTKEDVGLYADATILYMTYIKQVVDPTKFSAGFVLALSGRLAMEIALPLTNSTDMQQQMTQLYSVKLERAGAMDGLQGVNKNITSNRLINVR